MPQICTKEESRLCLTENGQWLLAGQPFEHAKIIEFFHQSIQKDERGEYYLLSGDGEWVYFEVQDTAYFVWDLSFDPEERSFGIRLNTGVKEVLDPLTLREDEREVVYCTLTSGNVARFGPVALRRLAEYAEEDEEGIYIDCTGQRIVISRR